MLDNLREKAGKFVLILISIILIFVFVYTAENQPFNGAGGSPSVGSVNGENITSTEFFRVLEQRRELFRKMGFPEEQLKLMPMEKEIFNSIVQNKLFVQFAEKKGFVPSHAEITDKIKELEFFQENGQFDLMKYKALLKQNNITPVQFEKDVRNQIISERWENYLNGFARVSEDEIKDEFIQLNDERTVRYVSITFEDAKKLLPISSAELKEFMQSEENKKKIQERFDSLKSTKFKDKKLEEAQNEIAEELLAQTKRDGIQAKRKELADKIAAEMSLSAASLTKINQWLKPMNLTVKTNIKVNRKSRNIPGVGDLPELTKELFGDSKAIDLSTAGGKAKIYETASGVIILGLESKKGVQMEKLDTAQRNSLRAQLTSQKKNALRSDLLRFFQDKSKVKENAAFFKTPDQG